MNVKESVFLCSFEERLSAQKAEREAATAPLGFKKPLSKEEKIEKKKLRLAAIGKGSGLSCYFCIDVYIVFFNY